jgi:uncharacterized protein
MVMMSERAVIKRHPERAVSDEAQEILARGLVAHVGFSQGEQPFVIPLVYLYDLAKPDRLYLHGSLASRTLKHLASGSPVCVTVTTLKGLVYSRSAQYHSMNYESVVCFGKARVVKDGGKKAKLFERLISRYHSGRVAGRDYEPPDNQQLMATAMVEVQIEEMSAKARRVGPLGPHDADPDAPGTCGVITFDEMVVGTR